MSSEAFAAGPKGVCAAWDDGNRVGLLKYPFSSSIDGPREYFEGPGSFRHPSITFNKNGDMILVWTEGTGWNRGGNLAWQVYNNKNDRGGEPGSRKDAISVWGLPAVIAEPNGDFTIFH